MCLAFPQPKYACCTAVARIIPFPRSAPPLSAEVAWERLRSLVIEHQGIPVGEASSVLRAAIAEAEVALVRAMEGR